MNEHCSHRGCLNKVHTDGECYKHRIGSIGFRWRGGGGYTQEAFHERTIGEKLIETVGDDNERRLAKRTDIMKAD